MSTQDFLAERVHVLGTTFDQNLPDVLRNAYVKLDSLNKAIQAFSEWPVDEHAIDRNRLDAFAKRWAENGRYAEAAAALNQAERRLTRRLYVWGMFATGSRYALGSLVLFRSGLLAQATALLRPAFESFFIGTLCSSPTADFLQRHASDDYDGNNSIHDLKKQSDAFHLNLDVLNSIHALFKQLLHGTTHPGIAALSVSYSFTNLIAPEESKRFQIDGVFDSGLKLAYQSYSSYVSDAAEAGQELLKAVSAHLEAHPEKTVPSAEEEHPEERTK